MTDKELEYNKNADAMQLATAKMKHRLDAIYLGGGQKKIEERLLAMRCMRNMEDVQLEE